MSLEELNIFCESINVEHIWDDAIDELADVMRENGESINDLNWQEQDTFYVDFVYDYLEEHAKDFDKKWNDWLTTNTIAKQVG